jgi:hypothetical protein
MLERILQLLMISCRHNRTSQPFAAAIADHRTKSDNWDSVGDSPGHYIVCLDCGKKFQYDWTNMRVVR